MLSHDKLHTVLSLLPVYIPNIDTLHSLLSTSRQTRQTILENLSPCSLFLILCNSSIYPGDAEEWYRLSLIASGFAPWLSLSSTHRRLFKRACPTLPLGLLNLAERYPAIINGSRLSLETMRKTIKRKEIVNGFSDLVDRCIGEQWYSTAGFWYVVEDAVTLEAEASLVVWQMVVYGEMFGRGVGGWLDTLLAEQTTADEKQPAVDLKAHTREASNEVVDTQLHTTYVDMALRCEVVKYAMADWHTPLWKSKDSVPWGLESDWEYPASLLSDDDEDVGTNEVNDEGCDTRGRGMPGAESDVDVHEHDEPSIFVQTQPYPSGSTPNLLNRNGDDDDGNSNDNATDNVENINDHSETPNEDDFVVNVNASNGEQDDDGPPLVHYSVVHPLRKVKSSSPWAPMMQNHDSAYATALLHLLCISPLWAEVTTSVRRRAMRRSKASALMSSSSSLVQSNSIAPPDSGVSGGTSTEGQAYNDPLQDGQLQAVEGEFGKSVCEVEWQEDRGWKQVIWEDALWTSGWDGLEVIADAWEWSGKNHKAIARRQARQVALSPELVSPKRLLDAEAVPTSHAQSGSNVVSRPNTVTSGLDERIKDDHPALARLAGIHSQLRSLEIEPPTVEFRSIARPMRKIKGWQGPVLVSDMDLLVWDPMWR